MKLANCFFSCTSFFLVYILTLTGLWYYRPSRSSGNLETVNEDDQEDENNNQFHKLSDLSKKWSIQGPKLVQEDETIYLDYIMKDFVTNDMLRHSFFEFECDDELEEPLLQSDQLVQLGKEEDPSEEGFQTWRLPLKVTKTNKQNVKTCVRWMLHNLPTSNEHCIQVNFVESQLTIQMRHGATSTISNAKVSRKKREGIQVNIFGSAKPTPVKDAGNEL
jgi:hypothetical protein